MSGNKTQPTDAPVATFLDGVTPDVRRQDAHRLAALCRDVTGFGPVLWGDSIIGYGRYDYRYASGREGTFLATGFSPRKAALSVYIMPGYADFGPILDRLGKHKKGKSCLYITRLSHVDLDVLADLIDAGLRDLGRIWPVQPT